MPCKYFLIVCSLPFLFLNSVFCRAIFFFFPESAPSPFCVLWAMFVMLYLNTHLQHQGHVHVPLCLLPEVLKSCILYLGLWPILSYFFVKGVRFSLGSFHCVLAFILSGAICWKNYNLSIRQPVHFCQKSVDNICVGLFWGFILFHRCVSIPPPIPIFSWLVSLYRRSAYQS